MEYAIALGIVNLILIIITWMVIDENQKIQDKHNEMYSEEIYKLKKMNWIYGRGEKKWEKL